MTAFTKFALVAATVVGLQLAGTSAQDISSQCQSTLASIVASPDASCLNGQALVGLIVSSSSDKSIVPSIDSWLKGLCGKAACSNSTLATVVQNVTAGCSSDLSTFGLANVDAGELTTLVQTAYPTVREVACLQNTQSNTLCVTESLNSLEPYVGTLSIDQIESIGDAFMTSGTIPNVPANVSCTDCVKASYSIVAQNFGDLIPDSTKSDLASTCGASFTDGAQPSTVSQLASDSQSSTTVTPNGAAPSFSAAPLVGVLASTLLAVSSAFLIFA